MKRALIIIFSILIADQALKVWVKTNMILGEEFHVINNFFIIHFTENNGMAFGMQFGGEYGKMLLSILRIIAIIAIGWYMYSLSKRSNSIGLISIIAVIFAGAVGNMIDSTFYGMLFSESYFETAQFFPADGGYGSFLHGKVVDMFYFPIIRGHFPDWFPVWGTEEFIFFRPVFNIADACISVGVIVLIIFQKRFFPKEVNS